MGVTGLRWVKQTLAATFIVTSADSVSFAPDMLNYLHTLNCKLYLLWNLNACMWLLPPEMEHLCLTKPLVVDER